MLYFMMGKRGEMLELESKEDCISKMLQNGWLARTISHFGKNDNIIRERIVIQDGVAKSRRVK